MSLIDTPATVDPKAQRAAAIAKFAALRVAAAQILSQASKIEGLPALLQAQGAAASSLAGLRLHQVHGEAGADDAHAIVADLEAIWSLTDPLIGAIGRQAQACFSSIGPDDFDDCFAGPVRFALEGNATYVLQRAAECITEEAADAGVASIDATAEHRTHAGTQ